MRTRRIAVVGLADDAGHAFSSMLKVLNGHASANWTVSAPEEADVLIAGPHGGDGEAQRWARTEKPLIAVYEGAALRPLTPYTLHHPFRVMQLLAVLDEIEQVLISAPTETARGAAVDPDWNFAESLRHLSRCTARGELHAAGSGPARIYVRDDISVYYASREMCSRLRSHAPVLPSLRLTSEQPPVAFESRPAFELAWFAGLHGPATLAPWLDAHAAYRLRRWPDFGLVRATRSQLALAALLTHAAHTRTRLVQLSQQSADAVDRFLNACAMAGVLVGTSESTPVAETSTFITSSAARLGGLIRGLRNRLGLAG